MNAQLIPFRLMAGGAVRPAGAPFRTGTLTISPLGALLLAPVFVPVVIAVLLALLAWFVLWLATVGALAARLVTVDIARGVLIRALDRRAMSFQGR